MIDNASRDHVINGLQLTRFLSLLMMNLEVMMEIMWLASQSDFHRSFIFIEMSFYSWSFLCDVYNKVYEHMQ